MTALRFDGRVAVVTGAGRGLGRAHALELASHGAAVVVNDLGTATDGSGEAVDVADQVVKEIEAAGGVAVANHDSVADAEGAGAIVGTALERFGRLDIVVNNAGNVITRPFPELGQADVESLLRVHFFGTFHVCQAAWGPLAAAGYGRIVNTVSAAMLGVPTWAGYGAAKGAVLGLTLGLATEGSASGIGVNAIAPGAATRMVTETAGDLPQAVLERFAAGMPPSLVSPVVAYLAHESCTLNGEVFATSAGRFARVTLDVTGGWGSRELDLDAVAEHLDDALAAESVTRWTPPVSG
ncbi:SDR family NAD(P)-dependent oxidoreductase [Cryptosporangium sp. NPDC051539]|uniref:SDR family NAD(P)-dependent oxidoreductase n=1 Tax=Cryptosporangium sp. NPDC051539 TaxID=3363962 RepID=UPI0037A38E25